MSLQIEKNISSVTAIDLPRQEFLLPFKPPVPINSDQPQNASQNMPQMITIYEQLHRMWDMDSFKWATSDTRNKILWNFNVTPNNLVGLIKNKALHGLHLHFRFDLIISLEIRSTVQHAGALAAVWVPECFEIDASSNTINPEKGYSLDTLWNSDRDQFFSNYFPTILNQQSEGTYEFRIPVRNIFDRWFTRPNDIAFQNLSLGNFVIFVYSPLNTATTITSLPTVVRYRLENIEYDTPTYDTPK